MRELVGSDIFHLAMESGVQPMHTLKVLLIDANGATGPTTPGTLRTWAEAVVPHIPPLKWQLTARSHWALGAPAWHASDSLDLSRHLRHRRVDPPGGREELGRAVAEIQAGMLDRSRPLWELWLLEGLGSGRVAHVWKIHHSVADGGGCARMLELAYQHSASEVAQSSAAGSHAEHVGEDDRSVARVLARHGDRIKRLPKLLQQSQVAVKSSRAQRKEGVTLPQKVMASPMTRYNRPLTPRRTTAAASMSMDDIATIRKAFDVTLNDVFVAVCGSAVRSHLLAAGELPSAPLTATVPVSIRRPEETDDYGNRMSFWPVCLETTSDDPVTRLLAIRDSARAAKTNAQRPGADRLLMKWQEYPPLFKAINQFGVVTSRLVGRPPYNMIISNVRGPEELWADGARVEEIASIGQLSTGLGLNMTGWSYCGRMTIGIVAVPEHEPDIWALADRLETSLAELLAAASTPPPNREDVPQ